MLDTWHSRAISAYAVGILGFLIAFIILITYRDSLFHVELSIVIITFSMWLFGFGTGVTTHSQDGSLINNKKHNEIQTMFDKINKEGEKMLLDAKVMEVRTKPTDDLLERPLYILTKGDLISYDHNSRGNPMIEKIVLRYNKKEYTFTISDISIKDKP